MEGISKQTGGSVQWVNAEMSERSCRETRCHLLQCGDLSCLLFQGGAGAEIEEKRNN